MDSTDQAADILSAHNFKKRNVAASTSSEQTSVSPGTSVKAIMPKPVPRSRPPYVPVSISEGTSYQRIWIPSGGKLLEEIDSKHNRSTPDDSEPTLSDRKGDVYFVEASAAAVHELKIDTSGSPELSSLRSLPLPPQPLSLTSAIAPKGRMKWARTQSGSIWIRKHRAAHETSSSDNSSPKEPAGIIIMPLVPPIPLSRSDLTTSKTSSVRVETPFPKAKDVKRSTSQASSVPPADKSTRKVPLATQKLLSAPVVALRRFVKTKQSAFNEQPSLYQETSNSPIEPQSHKSNLRRHQTGHLLNRVSSLLRESSRVPKIGRKFGTSGSDQARGHAEGQARGRAATFDISKTKSVEGSETTTTAASSILKMQMGATPLNSVLDTATYKVKRTLSQDTEEFLAIDISIRGGTSYLPSEARRIHTPPLPDDDVINNVPKQGVFFDYYPSNSTKASNSSSQQNNLQVVVSKGKRRLSQVVNNKAEPVTSTSSSLFLQNPSSKRALSWSQTKSHDSPSQEMGTPTKEESGHWFETPIAELDALVVDTEVSLSQPTSQWTPLEESSSEQPGIQTRTTREQHRQQQQYLDQLDWTIPEHLPSSPLCPRHPRY